MARKFVSQIVTLSLMFGLAAPWPAEAQLLTLPSAGKILDLSRPFNPVTIKGLLVHREDPFKFDFLVDSGSSHLKGKDFKAESLKLVKYFLAALTIPENEMWVNLSPYEKDRIVPRSLGETAMGRDLLAQDYILKQLAASLTYPEKQMGKQFWDKVYVQAQAKLGAVNVPTNTFNKVWILPQTAQIYESASGAFVTQAKLKVMLEEDYVALHKKNAAAAHTLASEVVRQVIVPALEQEVNEGSHFANLRQIYHAMVLAAWYKIRMKESLLGKLYANQRKTTGVALADTKANEQIYRRYLEAFKKGAYNYIKEEPQAEPQKTVARKYVSGGFMAGHALDQAVLSGLGKGDRAMVRPEGDMTIITVQTRNVAAGNRAMISHHPDYQGTVYSVSTADEPTFRIDEIFNLSLTEEENDAIIRQVKNDPNRKAVLLTKEAIKNILSTGRAVRLDETMGIVPSERIGKLFRLSNTISYILEEAAYNSFEDTVKNVNGWMVRLRVAGLFRIKVHDKANDRDLYLLTVEREREIKPFGGGYRFADANAKSEYGIPMQSLEDHRELRVKLAFGDIEPFIRKFNERPQDRDPQRELQEEWGTEFPMGIPIPKSWRGYNGASPAMVTPGGIDLDSSKLDLDVKKSGNGVALPVQLQGLRGIKIDGLYPVILSMRPVNDMQLYSYLQKY